MYAYFFTVNNVFEITPEEKVNRCDIGASRRSQNKTIPSDPTTGEPVVKSFSYNETVLRWRSILLKNYTYSLFLFSVINLWKNIMFEACPNNCHL
jgi:hypothetical protein